MVLTDALLTVQARGKAEDQVGGKISFFGGFCLIFNNACGAGVASIPLVFATAGWLPALIVMIFLWLSSTLASAMVCETMCGIPGNSDFSARVELSTCVQYFLGRRSYILTQVFLFLSLQSLNVSAIIISAQAVDQAFVHALGYSCGVGYHPSSESSVFGAWCVEHTSHDSPFGKEGVVASFGYVAAAIFAIPLGIFNLEDNINVQIACMWLTLACVGSWFWSLLVSPDTQWKPIPMTGPDDSQLIGTLLYNFAYVVTIPSWCNEKRAGVSVNRSLWGASSVCFLCYTFVGIIGASTFLHQVSPADDFLACLNHHGLAPVAVYFFPLMAALSGVPIFCIILRQNLLETNVCTRFTANLLAVVAPWLVALPLQTGNGLQTVINYTSLLFGSVVNFVIPFLVYAAYLWQGRRDRKRAAAETTVPGIDGLEHVTFPCLGSAFRRRLGLVYVLFVSMSILCLQSLAVDLDIADLASTFWKTLQANPQHIMVIQKAP
jgi:amino acid permease